MDDSKTRIHLTREQLDAMSKEQLANLVMGAASVEATAVVRRADGSIKYDDPTKAGTYGEEHLT